ncbi:cystathionine gamma-synthase [Streptococcus anginosus]|uniref:cystathionine gamma-synthase n=1 Tax=Streptococcus anginosus TaxID=1328 RepID=UPI0021F83F27|nr:cystathionine gamma-synthase [Streptococcus anginosus]MCW1052924.1 cystathionine gamma-synthase [Streptococcus anginosus]
MKEKTFPLISDDEVMLSEMPRMNLYDESDFISNINGDYVDKNYLEWEPIVKKIADSQVKEGQAKFYQATSAVQSVKAKKSTSKSYAELAREEARADLKKKRSAAYLTSDFTAKKRSYPAVTNGNTAISHQPTAFFQKENGSELAKYSRNLKQDHYILADIKVNTSLPKESPKKSKNNYDFLKTSQIYNKKELQNQRERRIAQELNLTRLEEK